MTKQAAMFSVAEFFAGIGLVRAAVEQSGGRVVFANDIEPFKHEIYQANFSAADFVLGDVRSLSGRDIPAADLATASFPCTDLSLAGKRNGLSGAHSGLFWEFARILEEMGERRPRAVLVENVPSLATSSHGRDLRSAIDTLNHLGYSCDLVAIDARHFVPQSRLRLFIVGLQNPADFPQHPGALAQPPLPGIGALAASAARPPWLRQFLRRHPDLRIHQQPLPPLPDARMALRQIAEQLPPNSQRWWNPDRVDRFTASLSPLQHDRLAAMIAGGVTTHAAAYRRTRQGVATWEIRADEISGCLRTSRGGSSKQALVAAGRNRLRIRWMTPREYAALQGVPDFQIPATVSENQALFGFGDAVCVPAVTWLLDHCLVPIFCGAEGRVSA